MTNKVPATATMRANKIRETLMVTYAVSNPGLLLYAPINPIKQRMNEMNPPLKKEKMLKSYK